MKTLGLMLVVAAIGLVLWLGMDVISVGGTDMVQMRLEYSGMLSGLLR
ncbi:MAG: hypothetical protein OEM59_15885 [Rhodospirillales bacterium]|nr:hypothetical protein [Rhodospirillales bacterium]